MSILVRISVFFTPVLFAALCLTGCSGGFGSPDDPWKTVDYRRPAQGAPNQLSKSSLTDPDLFYARSNLEIQDIQKQEAKQAPDADRSNIPYQRFQQTLDNFSNEDEAESNKKSVESSYDQQDFLGAKLPEDPGTVPTQQAQNQNAATSNDAFDLQQDATPTIKAALLVPLTGEHKLIGQAMLKASETAMFNIGAQDYELLPRDTKGTVQGAREAMQSAIDDGAHVIMGPLFAGSTKAIKPLARRHDIKVFSFTTDWTVADEDTYTMGFLPFSQVQKIVEHASREGLLRIGILAPDNQYGQAVIQAYQANAAIYGLETINIVKYPVTSPDISPIIREFTNYDFRVEELNQLIRPLKDELKLRPNDDDLKRQIAELEAQDTAGEPPYDAVLLPIGGEQAKAIANLLSFYDLDPEDVVRLGTGVWDDPALATEPNMEGGRFAASSPQGRRSFENQYRRLYGVNPPRLASLAYDATALTVVLGRNRLVQGFNESDLYKERDITNPNGYAGVDGIFRFRPDGLIERGLSILTFNKRRVKILEDAPTTFEEPRRF